MTTNNNPIKTVVFADISGSTALFDVLGNAEATRAVTTLTRQMALAIKRGGGRVVKKLGDGVFGVFGDPVQAVAAVVQLMREHRIATRDLPESQRLAIRIGLATGEVVEVEGDCYGDAVNVAARLCELAGTCEVMATEPTIERLQQQYGTTIIRLGHMEVRGKADRVLAYQIEWREEETPETLTVQAGLASGLGALGMAGVGRLQFEWHGTRQWFTAAAGTVYIGRGADCHVRVDDARVSRVHARVDWRQGSAILTDVSSFGTWVHFADAVAPAQLRRESCLLHGAGEIAMSVPFADPGAPILAFLISSGEGRGD